MAHYLDGYVVPVPKRNLPAYLKLAKFASKLWREHGALEFRESVGDDLEVEMCLPFPRGIKIKSGETVVFSSILFKSRAHRDRVNAKVMKDPRMAGMMSDEKMPFEGKRMLYGGFKVAVDA